MATHNHRHDEDHEHDHGHTHGVVDPTILTTRRGIWAVKWSFAGLMVTALLQVIVVYFSGSVALLADTIHNFGDAATAIPLGIAFLLARRKPTKRFTYGYGRVEDLAGVVIVLMILLSAIVAGYESVRRIFEPREVQYLGAVVAASLIGLIGNEAVALFRIRVGKEIGSAALVADGYHARVDGLTSLAVLLGALGVWLGFPLADPIVGLGITVAILKIVWDSAKSVFARLLDGVDPEIVDEITHAAGHAPGVQEVTQVQVRWLGHRLHTEVHATVDADLSVAAGHQAGQELQHALLHRLQYLSSATIHIDPADASGPAHHRVSAHEHDSLPAHAH